MEKKIQMIIKELRNQYGFDPDYVAALSAMYDVLLLLYKEIREHQEANEEEAEISDLGIALLDIEPVLDALAYEITQYSLPEDYNSEGE